GRTSHDDDTGARLFECEGQAGARLGTALSVLAEGISGRLALERRCSRMRARVGLVRGTDPRRSCGAPQRLMRANGAANCGAEFEKKVGLITIAIRHPRRLERRPPLRGRRMFHRFPSNT